MSRSFFTHLECTRTGQRYDLDGLHNLSDAGAPFFARYDLGAARGAVSREELAGRTPSMWRYREVMPLRAGDEAVTLDEGWTPLRRARRLGDWCGFRRLWVKDESVNPTGSFKARGLSAAVTAAAARGAAKAAIPHGGKRRRRPGRVRRRRRPGVPRLHAAGHARRLPGRGDRLRRPPGAGGRPDHRLRAHRRRAPRGRGLVRHVHPEGALPGGGQEDDGLRAGRAARLEPARRGRLPHRRGHRADRHVEGLRGDGAARLDRAPAAGRAWSRYRPPGAPPSCAPSRPAASPPRPWTDARTIASGLRVPGAVADFLMLRALRESGGTAVAVTDEELIARSRDLARHTGIFPAPEGGATLAALLALKDRGWLGGDERVVLFNTGSGYKYLEALS